MAQHSSSVPVRIGRCKPGYGSLTAWRAALFATLGLGAANGCGDPAEPYPTVGDEAGSPGTQAPTSPTDQPSTDQTSATDQIPATNQATPSDPKLLCEDPMPYLVIDGVSQDTGYFACRGHWYHRRERKDCPSFLPRAGTITGYQGDTCEDSSCTERPHGACVQLSGLSPRSVDCRYGCVRDEECGAGEVCLCGDPVGTCVRAACTSDADCAGTPCVGTPNRAACGPGEVVFFDCAKSNDECLSGSECESGLICEQRHEPAQAMPGARRCDYGPVCGRPFLVAGQARLAGTEAGAGWLLEQASPDLGGLSSSARAALAQHWTEIGRMEHASVAAFARFVLELLAAGAPAELLSAAQRALGDEIEHARLCFGLASAYRAAPVGPSPLDTRGVLEEGGLRATVRAAIHEACIGETLAAVEAREALEGATDPAVRAVLHAVVRDESAHAELGWKFLQWALDGASAELCEFARVELQRAVEAALVTRSPLAESDAAPELERHGLCPESRRRAAGRAAIEQLVLPLSRAIIASARQPQPARPWEAEG